MKKSKKFNALMGFGKKAIPVRVDPKLLFKFSSTERPVPTFRDLIMLKSTEEIKNVEKGKIKKKIPNHAILPPEFSETLLDKGEMEVEDLMLTMADKIREIIIQKEIRKDDEKEDMEDQETLGELSKGEETEDGNIKKDSDPFQENLLEYEEAYYGILIFSWAMIHDKKVVPGTLLNPALDKASIQQAEIIHKNVFGEGKTRVPEEDTDTTGLQAILSEFGSRIDRNTAISQAKASLGEREDSKKDWLRLTPISCNVLEGMQAKYNSNIEDDDDDDIIIPSGPNVDQEAIIQCSTGARVQQYLNHLMITVHGCVVCVGMGMGTAIKNGLIMSQPTPYEPTNYSPHFTPPSIEDGLSSESQLRLEEQARNGKLSSEDMILITQQKIKSPTNYNELRHYTKNFHCLNKIMAGVGSILETGLRMVASHVMDYETDYVFHFNELPLFGAWFINKIHVGVQKFLHSCALGELNKLDLKAIDFVDLLRSIQDRSIAFVRAPSYVKDQLPKPNKNKRKPLEDDTYKIKKGKGNQGKDNKIENDEQDNQAKLGNGMAFGEVFCKEIRKGVTQPKMDDGTEMCNRFYGKGYCFQNCKRSHKKKNASEQTCWKKFLQTIIARYKERRKVKKCQHKVSK